MATGPYKIYIVINTLSLFIIRKFVRYDRCSLSLSISIPRCLLFNSFPFLVGRSTPANQKADNNIIHCGCNSRNDSNYSLIKHSFSHSHSRSLILRILLPTFTQRPLCLALSSLSSSSLFHVNSNFLLLLLFCYYYNGYVSVVSGVMTVAYIVIVVQCMPNIS